MRQINDTMLNFTPKWYEMATAFLVTLIMIVFTYLKSR